ncbi:hypothetical protein PMAYCL1PPCAC_15874, partial [Pristionchus mayeri]
SLYLLETMAIIQVSIALVTSSQRVRCSNHWRAAAAVYLLLQHFLTAAEPLRLHWHPPCLHLSALQQIVVALLHFPVLKQSQPSPQEQQLHGPDLLQPGMVDEVYYGRARSKLK